MSCAIFSRLQTVESSCPCKQIFIINWAPPAASTHESSPIALPRVTNMRAGAMDQRRRARPPRSAPPPPLSGRAPNTNCGPPIPRPPPGRSRHHASARGRAHAAGAARQRMPTAVTRAAHVKARSIANTEEELGAAVDGILLGVVGEFLAGHLEDRGRFGRLQRRGVRGRAVGVEVTQGEKPESRGKCTRAGGRSRAPPGRRGL